MDRFQRLRLGIPFLRSSAWRHGGVVRALSLAAMRLIVSDMGDDPLPRRTLRPAR